MTRLWLILLSALLLTSAAIPQGLGQGGLSGTPSSLVLGNPTGGNQGAGTLNATGVFVNGVPVGTGSGTVTTSGSPTSGQFAQFTSSTAITGESYSSFPSITLGTGNTITPSSGGGIVGTTGGTVAPAGAYGELQYLACFGGAGQTVTITIATPAVITWGTGSSTEWGVSATNPAAWTCPITFSTTGALPTGLTATTTTYWVVGALVSGNNFYLTDTTAHALACASTSCTGIVSTSGTQSGTQTGTMGSYMTTGTWTVGASFNLTAGDWDCASQWQAQAASLTGSTGYKSGLNTTVGAPPLGEYSTVSYASGSIGSPLESLLSPTIQQLLTTTTTIYGIGQVAFTGGTSVAGAYMRCRRMH